MNIEALKRVLQQLFAGQDYRAGVVSLLNADFLDYVVGFFKKVVEAKMAQQSIDEDWYRRYFLSADQRKRDLITHAGLNEKTIHDMHNSTRKEVVISAVNDNYDALLALIRTMLEKDGDIQIELTIRFRGVSVDLNLSESLIVINALAVKRSQMRGGVWSSVGKRTELPLMLALAKLYSVPPEYYKLKGLNEQKREVDFHFVNRRGDVYFCEVKLMGAGNPESADAVFARGTQLFIADKLSDATKRQLESAGIHWVEMRAENGFERLYSILQTLEIPCQPARIDALDHIIDAALAEAVTLQT